MKREWVVDVVEKLPAGAVSRAWGWLARRQQPRVGIEALKRTFVMATGINMAESEGSMREFRTLEELFVRRLKKGARRIDPDPTAAVSPVDGTVGACGIVEDGTLIQVKGRNYSLSRLLDDPDEAKRYEGGPFATFYLSPKDYHRIHSPVSGRVARATLIPGRLLPVFPEALEKVDELFAKNERVITYLDTPDAGRIAVVKVGATLVGRISVSYDPAVRTNTMMGSRRDVPYDPPIPLPKGADLGAFELGSTVVLVAEPGRLAFDKLSPEVVVRMGERIGTITARAQKPASKPRKPRAKKPKDDN